MDKWDVSIPLRRVNTVFMGNEGTKYSTLELYSVSTTNTTWNTPADYASFLM